MMYGAFMENPCRSWKAITYHLYHIFFLPLSQNCMDSTDPTKMMIDLTEAETINIIRIDPAIATIPIIIRWTISATWAAESAASNWSKTYTITAADSKGEGRKGKKPKPTTDTEIGSPKLGM